MSLESPDNTLNVRNAVLKISRVEMNTLSANTVTSDLTVSGNVTATSNLTVGGELTVSGNVQVGDANLYMDTTTGRVGVGTNAPMGTLDVKGVLNHTQVANVAQITSNSNVVMEYRRSKKIIRYPRVALTVASGESSGYQGYYVTESSNSANTDRHSWKAFNMTFDNTSGDNAWANDQTTTTYNGTDNAYNGSINLGTGTVNGEWIKLQLPHKIKLEYMKIWLKDNDPTRIPENWKLYGSDDNLNWTELFSKTGQGAINENLYNVNATSMYNYLAVVVTKISGQNDYFRIVELEFFGLPEYDPEAHGTEVVLHTTPNVPNTDFSNVYYDGQDYTSMPATVADKSGNGVTGTPSGGIGFDSTYKAFTFDGVDDQITATLTNPAGAWVHSVSMWFKVNSLSATNTLFSMNTALGANKTPHLVIHTNGLLSYGFSSNDVYFGGLGTIVPNKWYHLSVTYSGGSDISSRKVFLNSVELGFFAQGATAGTIAALDALTNSTLKIGTYPNGTNPFNGSIANFRLYNQALSVDEIWEIYAYQKEYFGVSPDAVTLKAGRLGIGTSEPRAVLDVRGSSRFDAPITLPRALFNPGYSRSAIIYTGTNYRTKYQNVHEYYQNLIIPPVSEMSGYSIDSQWYTLGNYTSGNSLNTTIIDTLVYWLKNRRDGHIHESQFIVSSGTHFERVYGQKFATHFRLWGYGERSNHTHTKYYSSNYNLNLTSAAELSIYYSETVL